MYEFLDNDMWTHLDALLVKIGVKSIFLSSRHANLEVLGLASFFPPKTVTMNTPLLLHRQ